MIVALEDGREWDGVYEFFPAGGKLYIVRDWNDNGEYSARAVEMQDWKVKSPDEMSL